MPAPSARRQIGAAFASSTGVVWAYWLFSHTKTTGSDQIAARLSDSSTTPWLMPPSPKKATATLSLPLPAHRKGRPARDRHAGADDAVGAVHPGREVRDVHGTAAPGVVPVDPAQQLGEHPRLVAALGDHVPVAAVGAGDDILGLERRADSDRHCLLTDVLVGDPGDLVGVDELDDPLLEQPDAQHRLVVLGVCRGRCG